ncbi:MAG: (deoxy)nucleoside triphosphate pyrophosphohydrolase [Clostridia bacterium]|nr:(deoxy)nucleoside triphosphate pyrophosphohydrolase [Clostridia bacterium]MBQ8767372.1 (deoxy)nucleoside triphosphate pyrophosphohydrolase [Clostridia bacterium]
MIKVVAAVIEKDGRYLLCKRGPGGNCAFLWEFPGGKIEEGEAPNEALIREIREELCIEILPSTVFCEYPYSYPDKDIYFYFIRAQIISGEINPLFHSEIRWLLPEELDSLDYCPADLSTVEKLKGGRAQ